MALTAMSLALAIVQPFAVVIVYAAAGRLLCSCAGGAIGASHGLRCGGYLVPAVVTLPLSVYTLWVTQADPVLRGWTAQNVTPSPPVWDYALGYGLVLVLAVPGAVWPFGGAPTLICCCWPGWA